MTRLILNRIPTKSLVQIESNTSKVDDKGSDLVDRPTNDEARVQANRLIEEASAGSKSILDQAQSQAEKLLEDAKRQAMSKALKRVARRATRQARTRQKRIMRPYFQVQKT